MASTQSTKNSKPAKAAGPLQFAPSTFGLKREKAPVTQERLEALRQLHAGMITKGADGSDVFPSKTAFVVAAHKAGYSTNEIAELLGQKPAVIYSMIWRVTAGYKPRRKPKDGAQAAAGAAEHGEAGDLEDIEDEDLDAADDELADDDI